MGTKVTWLGHSAFSLDTGEYKVLIDPFLTGNPVAPMGATDLEADFILLTHGHGDHVGDTVAIAKRTGAMIASNVEVGNWLKKQGAEKVTGFNTGGTANFDFGSVKLTLAFHSSSMPDGSYGGSPNGMIIRIKNGPTIHDCGDTALFSDMQLIAGEEIDLALVPIGDFYTMGVKDSIRAIQYLRPRYVIPIHFNTWPLLAQDAGQWAQMVANETDAQPLVLDPGGIHNF